MYKKTNAALILILPMCIVSILVFVNHLPVALLAKKVAITKVLEILPLLLADLLRNTAVKLHRLGVLPSLTNLLRAMEIA